MTEIFGDVLRIWFLCALTVGLWVSSLFIFDQLKKVYLKIKNYFSK
jgi:hypothetical protein